MAVHAANRVNGKNSSASRLRGKADRRYRSLTVRRRSLDLGIGPMQRSQRSQPWRVTMRGMYATLANLSLRGCQVGEPPLALAATRAGQCLTRTRETQNSAPATAGGESDGTRRVTVDRLTPPPRAGDDFAEHDPEGPRPGADVAPVVAGGRRHQHECHLTYTHEQPKSA